MFRQVHLIEKTVAETLSETAETMRKGCGNGAERLRKDRGNTAGTKLQGGNTAEMLRKWCGKTAETLRTQCGTWAVPLRGLSSIAIDCPGGIWDSHESHGMAPRRGGCTLQSHGVPSVGLCPSCPSHPSVPRNVWTVSDIPWSPICRSLSQLSVPSLSPQGTYGQ